MGRHREFPGVEHFAFTTRSAVCKILDCGYRYEPRPGSQLHSKPLVDHLKRKHPEEYKKALDEDEKKSSKRKLELISSYFPTESASKRARREVIEIDMSREKVEEYAVEATTVNGLPLSVFEKSGISKLISPILCKLGMSLNQKAVRSLILGAYERKVNDINNEFSDRMVCVKTDLCTRHGRHFLGVNFQSVIKGKLRVVTASVKEMTARATGAEIQATLLASMRKLGIREQQIYTLTTDNGSNVVKAGKLMQEDAAVDDEASDSEADTPEDNYKLSDELRSVTVAAKSVTSMRCAAHTLQLSVHDVINSNEHVKEVLVKVRKIVKKTHTQNMRLMFRQNGTSLPKLDCDTRWGSTFNMLQSVASCRPFLQQLGLANESLFLGEEEWAFIDDLIVSLKPLHETTVSIQLRDLAAGEFLCEWLKCKVKLSKAGNGTSAALLQAMEEREVNILNNSAFLSAVYMDPRFQCLMSEPQKQIAKAHLTTLWKRLLSMSAHLKDSQCEKENLVPRTKNTRLIGVNSLEAEAAAAVESDESIIDSLLKQSDSTAQSRAATNMSEASLAVESFDNTQRVDRNENVLHWWHCHPHSDLRKLAEVVLALPVTQASVERTFSGLHYILNEKRSCLKADIIYAIMVLRCNT